MRQFVIAFLLLLSNAISAAAEPDWVTIRKELESLHALDQDIRNELTKRMEQDRAKGSDATSPEQQAMLRKMSEQDQRNRERLDQLVAQAGWPGKSKVGELASTTAWLIVQHGDLEYQKRYFPLLKKAAEEGELRKAELALTEDRMLMREGKPQLYGSQVRMRDGTDLHPVQDPENLDARRKSMGLPPICEYLQKFVPALGPIKYEPCMK